jgi:hypothetical protein
VQPDLQEVMVMVLVVMVVMMEPLSVAVMGQTVVVV